MLTAKRETTYKEHQESTKRADTLAAKVGALNVSLDTAHKEHEETTKRADALEAEVEHIRSELKEARAGVGQDPCQSILGHSKELRGRNSKVSFSEQLDEGEPEPFYEAESRPQHGGHAETGKRPSLVRSARHVSTCFRENAPENLEDESTPQHTSMRVDSLPRAGSIVSIAGGVNVPEPLEDWLASSAEEHVQSVPDSSERPARSVAAPLPISSRKGQAVAGVIIGAGGEIGITETSAEDDRAVDADGPDVVASTTNDWDDAHLQQIEDMLAAVSTKSGATTGSAAQESPDESAACTDPASRPRTQPLN